MTAYTADNMIRFLGPDANDVDAQHMGEYLESRGWELALRDGEYVAFRDGEEMTDAEWQAALSEAFDHA